MKITLRETIKAVRDAIECDQCNSAYRQQYGCKQGGSSTEIMACQIEHAKYRESGQMRH